MGSTAKTGAAEGATPRAARIVTALWLTAIVIAAVDLVHVVETWWLGSDFQPTVLSVADLFHRHPIDQAFVYPPGLLIIGAPLILLQHGRQAELAMLGLAVIGIGFSVFGISRMTKIPLSSPQFGLLALLLAVSGNVIYVLQLENLTILLLPLAVGFYWLLLSKRWMLAGAVLGLSLTIKPMLLPLLLLLLLEKRWKASALAIAVPAVTSVAALAVSADPKHFLHAALGILSGNSRVTGSIDLSGLGALWGANGAAIGTARVVVVVVAVVAAYRAWARPGSPMERYVIVGEGAIACLLLGFVFTHTFYALLLLPIVALGLTAESTSVRVLAYAAAVLVLLPVEIVHVVQWPGARATSTLLFLGMVLAIGALATGLGSRSLVLGQLSA